MSNDSVRIALVTKYTFLNVVWMALLTSVARGFMAAGGGSDG